MVHGLLKQCLLGVMVALVCVTTPAYAVESFKTSSYGGANQIWFEAEDFDQRDPADESSFALSDIAGAFGRTISSLSGTDGASMIRYTFNISKTGGAGGSWYFWGRVINPNNNSDFMLVDGHPGDTMPVTVPVSGLVNEQRIFEQSGLGDDWLWAPTAGSAGEDSHTKTLKDGENTMYILAREAGATWDVFMWTDDPDYVPTDEDYENATAPVAGTASDPSPAGGAIDIPREVMLSWAPGEYVVTHDVYFGTDVDDVNAASTANPLNVLASAGQNQISLDAGTLAFDQTYYWRVDEVNGAPDRTVFKGNIWSFTVEPKAIPVETITATASGANDRMEPENTINGSGLNAQDEHSTTPSDMWLAAGASVWIQYEFDQAYKLHEMLVWNSNQQIETFIGFGIKEASIETSVDGATWTTLEGVRPLAQATGLPSYTSNTTVDLGGTVAKYVKISSDSAYGSFGQMVLSEVRFLYIPTTAREPQPVDQAVTDSVDVQVSWRVGREAVSHQVYLGSDPDALALADTTAENSYLAQALDYDSTYHWSVTEVNDAEIPAAYPSAVWSFSTPAFGVVDDFESYSGDEGQEVFMTWFDGFGGDASLGGSTTGHIDSPFVETSIVNGGGKSMPVFYDNDGGFVDLDGKMSSPGFSEVVREFGSAQDWNTGGIKTLSIMFAGAADNTPGQLYCKIGGTKLLYDGDAANLASSAWQAWNIDLSTVGGNLGSVRELAIGIEGSGAGVLYLDDIRLYPRLGELILPVEPDNANLLAYYTFEGNANDSSGNGLHGAVSDGQIVGPGKLGAGSAVYVQQSGYVDLGNPKALDFATGDWTVTAWYKTAMTGTAESDRGTLYAKGGDTAGGHRYALILSEGNEGAVTLLVDDDATKVQAHSSSKTNDDEWHFVAGQRAGQVIHIYIDGQLEASSALPDGYDLSGTVQHNAYIGASTDHTNNVLFKLFNGFIDEVQVHGRALSAEEILWLAGKTKPVHKPL